MVPRKVRLALIALAAGGLGCSAGSTGRLAVRSEPPVARPTATVAQIVERTNANAQQVEALSARTSVIVNSRRVTGALEGNMAMERPNNFHLKLKRAVGAPMIELGSNDQDFWVWNRESEEKAVYIGDNSAVGFASADLPFQPDWIVEALGLRPIPAEEESRIEVVTGKAPNTLVMTHDRDDGRGGTVRKQTVVDANTRRVLRHVYLAADGRTPLAVVTPENYHAFSVVADDRGTPSSVELPLKVRVQLYTSAAKNPDDLEVQLSQVEVNPEFTTVQRQVFFEVPTYVGYEPRRLVDGPSYAADERPREYQSRSIPPAGADLGEPLPFGTDGASLQRRDPMPLSPDLLGGPADPRGVDAIVRTGLPQLPGEDRSSVEVRRTASDQRPLGSGFVR